MLKFLKRLLIGPDKKDNNGTDALDPFMFATPEDSIRRRAIEARELKDARDTQARNIQTDKIRNFFFLHFGDEADSLFSPKFSDYGVTLHYKGYSIPLAFFGFGQDWSIKHWAIRDGEKLVFHLASFADQSENNAATTRTSNYTDQQGRLNLLCEAIYTYYGGGS